MKLRHLILISTAALTLQAHAGRNAQVISHIANDVIVKTYTDLAAGAANFDAKTHALAAAPNAANLAAAQQAWRDMRVFWEASEAFLFGPVESLSIDPTIDTWPLNISDLDSILASNRPLDKDTVRKLGVNLQGFHVTEYILFGTGEHGPNKTIDQINARQLQYLIATSDLLAEHTQTLAAGWTTNADPRFPNLPGYASFLANPKPSNRFYKTEQSVLIELVNGMVAIVTEVGTGKIPDPMGANASVANGQLVESPFSWNSLNDFANNIRSAQSVFTGSYGGVAGPGVRDVVARVNPGLATQVEQQLQVCIDAIFNIAGPEKLDFRQAIFDNGGRTRAQGAMSELLKLQNLLTKQVLPLVEKEN